MRTILSLCACLALAAPTAAQTQIELEAGGGYTLVDVEAVAEADGAIANEWEQPSYRISARAFFGPPGETRFGAELGYQHLYWYSVRIPYGVQPIRRDYAVSGASLLGLMRLGAGAPVVDLGAGLAFPDGAAPALSVGLGWEVAPNVAIKLRADGVIDEEPVVPLGVGVSYAFQR